MYFFAALRLDGLKSVVGPGIEGGHCSSRVVSCGDAVTLLLRGGNLLSILAKKREGWLLNSWIAEIEV